MYSTRPEYLHASEEQKGEPREYKHIKDYFSSAL